MFIENINNSNKAFVLDGLSKDIFELINSGKSDEEVLQYCLKEKGVCLESFSDEYSQFIKKLMNLNIIESVKAYE